MAAEPQQDGLLTTEQVAALLGVTPKTIYVQTERGRIPCYKVGRLNRYDREEVLAALRVSARPDPKWWAVRLWDEGVGVPKARPGRRKVRAR